MLKAMCVLNINNWKLFVKHHKNDVNHPKDNIVKVVQLIKNFLLISQTKKNQNFSYISIFNRKLKLNYVKLRMKLITFTNCLRITFYCCFIIIVFYLSGKLWIYLFKKRLCEYIKGANINLILREPKQIW